jgi:hypothetical protein
LAEKTQKINLNLSSINVLSPVKSSITNLSPKKSQENFLLSSTNRKIVSPPSSKSATLFPTRSLSIDDLKSSPMDTENKLKTDFVVSNQLPSINKTSRRKFISKDSQTSSSLKSENQISNKEEYRFNEGII